MPQRSLPRPDRRKARLENSTSGWRCEACTRNSQFGCPLDQGEDGRTDGACYTALRLLSAKGILKSLGVGAYENELPKARAEYRAHKEALAKKRERMNGKKRK